jgi:glutamate-1-semialdehyde 2,1-aminomutase
MTSPPAAQSSHSSEQSSTPTADWQARLQRAIPGGAHTYSRGADQFPANAPQIFTHGSGVYAFDPQGRKYLDFAMALGAVCIGYGEPDIVAAAQRGMTMGNGLSRPSVIELEAAERLIGLVPSIDMVKFTKNGSTAVTAAVKLARAYTGRELVARCSQHPFFSYDDWFIGSTAVKRGITKSTIQETLAFDYNDASSVERLLVQNKGVVAALVLEPASMLRPKITGQPADAGFMSDAHSLSQWQLSPSGASTFLHEVRELCDAHGTLLILDEMITGFRWDIAGAQRVLGVRADITTFGKAMANGFSVAAVGGRRDIMELGSIEFSGTERVFLLSTTHGAEMSSLAAFMATVDFLQQHRVCEHLWAWGESFINVFNQAATKAGVHHRIRAGGPGCKPGFVTLDDKGQPCMGLRTLFMQEMIKHGILMPQVVVAYRHGPAELALVQQALDQVMPVIAQGVDGGVERLIQGPLVKPVFRKWN